MTVRAAIYCRISSDRAGAGLGVKRQAAECRELADRLGWDVVEVYDRDNDVSAYDKTKKRLDWERMLTDLEAGHLDAVLAWHVDRMYRRPRDLDRLIEIIESRNVQVQTVTAGTLDLSNPAGVAMAKTAAVFAEYESAQKARRQRSKAAELAKAGKIGGGGTRPFGYESDRTTVRESEAEHVRDAARRILDHSETIHGLCREWNSLGVATVTGARWTPHVLRRMLMSARISGRREHNKTVVADAIWPKIITADESDRLREMLSDPARATVDWTTARRYLLTGFAYCGRCGARIKARPYPNRDRSYVCARKEGGIHLTDDAGTPLFKPDGSPLMCGQGNLRIHAESLELYVAEAAFDYLDEFVHLAATLREDDPEAQQEADLWRSMANYQRRLEALERRFYVEGALPERTFDRLSKELAVEMERTHQQIARVTRRSTLMKLPASSAYARAVWKERDFDWHRLLLTTLVERVTVGPGVRGRNKFDPDRVSIVWRRPV